MGKMKELAQIVDRAKQTMNTRICDAIRAFEDETKCKVEGIAVTRVDEIGGHSSVVLDFTVRI